VHWADLTDTDVHDGIVTTPARTLGDCLRRLPFDEALSIADSAARHDDVDQPTQVLIADRLRGPGSGQARLVARLATAKAANPFESVLRAIAHPVTGLMFEPQVPIELPGGTVCPDLTDRRLGIVAEANSFSWHGDRRALRSDCRRYNRLTVAGWLVLRFAWEDVMLHASDVQACLVAARSLVGQRAQRPPRRPKAA
jgi:very-short-patch-repair endonuclease